MCGPAGCDPVEGPVVCQPKVKEVILHSPEEQCDLQPQEYCQTVTRLVPRLKEVQECLDVPKEVCATSRSPRKVVKPSLMTWCYRPLLSPQVCRSNTDCPEFSSCQAGDCVRCQEFSSLLSLVLSQPDTLLSLVEV